MLKFYPLVLLFIFFNIQLSAQDGSLDNSFGNNGTLSLDNGTNDAQFLAIAESSNQLIAAGFLKEDNRENIVVAGFNLDGSSDNGFGVNGVLTMPLGSGNGRITSIVLQPDGKFVLGGWSRFGGKDQYVVMRMDATGAMDNSFGTDGISTGSFGGSSFQEDEVAEVQLLSDGKIVVAGRAYNGQNDDGFVGCFNADGSLNTAFGTDGVYKIQFDISPPSEQANAMTVDDQDNIYVGGTASTGFNTEDEMFILKLNAQGVPDQNFGSEGHVTLALDAGVIAGLNTLTIDGQGRIVTGGGAFDTNQLDNNFFLTRFMPTGAIDNSFGNSGVRIIQRNSNESIWSLKVLDNSDIIAAGSTGGFPSSFAVVRLNDSGVQDLTFGNNGWATTSVESGFNSIRSISTEGDGIIAAGSAQDGSTYKMALAKYRNAGMSSNVEELISDVTAVEIFPNPVSDNFSLKFKLEISAPMRIDLVDINGRWVANLLSQQQIASGPHTFNFHTPKFLAKGNYFIVLNFEEDRITKKIKFIE